MDGGYKEATQVAGTLGIVGMVIGLGTLLASTEKLTVRIVVGRALVSTGLGMSSAALLVFLPEIPLAAQMGVAALFASLGTSALERLFQKFIGGSK